MAYNASPALNDDRNMQSAAPPVLPGQSAPMPASETTSQSQQAPPPQANTGASTGVQNKPASSGSFTNLQSYMNQNKNAGQQLTNRIGTTVNRDIGTTVNQTNRALTSTEKANQALQQNLSSGQNYLQQMSGGSSYVPTSGETPSYLNPYITPNSPSAQQTPTPQSPGTFSAQSFINDPAKLAQYNALRTGTQQAADQAALNANLTNTTQQQGNAENLVSNLQNQLGSSNNRQNLLSQYVNRNPLYSQSAQNLDSYFLQKDQQGLNSLQNQVKGTQNTTLKDISNQINSLQSGAKEATQAGTDLSTNLQNKSNENVQGLLDQLQGETGEVNARRTAEQAYAQDQFNKLKSGQAIDQRFADTLGLNQGQRLYSSVMNMNDPTGILNFSQQQAQTAADVANQQDVQQYAALAKLAGIDPSSYALSSPSALQNAVSSRTDNQGNINSIIGNIQNEIAGTNSSGTYASGGSNGGFNAGPTGSYSTSGNLANIGSILDKYGIKGNTAAEIQAATGAAQTSNPAVTNELLAAYGVSGGWDRNNGQALAASQALQNAYQQLANYGYFNQVNIAPNT